MNTFQNNTNSKRRPFISTCTASCQKLISKIQITKRALLNEFRQRVNTQDRMLQLALNEAEALACDTGFPILTFPILAREKAEAVAAWISRQQAVRRSALQSLVA